MALDCITEHHVEIFDRGGKVRRGELSNIGKLTWNRVRDDTSQATVTISQANCKGQESTLEKIRSNRHEIVIYRGDGRSWEGPCTLREDGLGNYVITAKDISWYGQRLVLSAAYSNAAPNTTTATQRAINIITAEFTRKDTVEAAVGLPSVNVIPYLVRHVMAGEAGYAGSTLPYTAYVTDHIKTLAQNNGIDFVVVGRAWHFWDTSFGLTQTPLATQNDFLGALKLTEYGAEGATVAYATDGQGNAGSFGAVDPYYGLVERLNQVYDATTDTGAAPTVAEMTSQAQRDLAGRNPAPYQLRIPDGSRINPNGVLKTSHLVPGAYIPLQIQVGLLPVTQMQKLKQVTFTEDPTQGGESITATLYPASGPDLVDGGV